MIVVNFCCYYCYYCCYYCIH